MDGYNLHEELAPELWRATSGEGASVLVKFPKDCASLSALSLCRKEYDIGSRLRDAEGVLAPKQVLEGDDLVGLLYDDCEGNLLSKCIPAIRAKAISSPIDGIQEILFIAIKCMYS